MSSKLNRCATAIAALVLLSIPAGDVLAASDEVCRDYAQAALRQVKLMHEHRCGFTTARWSDDWNVHFQWCRGVSYEQVGFERDVRTRELRQCYH
jgi:hypothetical protein